MYLLIAWVLIAVIGSVLWWFAPRFGQPWASWTKIVVVVLAVAAVILLGFWVYQGIALGGWVSTHPLSA